LRVLDVIARDNLAANARHIGDFLLAELKLLAQKFPTVLCDARGFGLMIGLEFEPRLKAFQREKTTPAIQVVNRLHAAGLLTVPAATSVVRLLPALNLRQNEAEQGLRAIWKVVETLNRES
jgi:L-lysine 6-transaminase